MSLVVSKCGLICWDKEHSCMTNLKAIRARALKSIMEMNWYLALYWENTFLSNYKYCCVQCVNLMLVEWKDFCKTGVVYKRLFSIDIHWLKQWVNFPIAGTLRYNRGKQFMHHFSFIILATINDDLSSISCPTCFCGCAQLIHVKLTQHICPQHGILCAW